MGIAKLSSTPRNSEEEPEIVLVLGKKYDEPKAGTLLGKDRASRTFGLGICT